MWKYWRHGQWTNRKIAFVAILIATSVAFVLIFNKIVPVTSLPSFKIMAGGLPIKLTGYIFGPVIGFITGVISDILSFAMMPTFFHWWYTLAFALAGTVPGIVGYFMHRRWKNKGGTTKEDEIKCNNVNFFITLFVLGLVMMGVVIFVLLQDESVFAHQDLIKDRYIFLSIALVGSSTMFIAVIVFRFVLKPKTFNALMPIITFSALLEVINTPLIALGDINSFDLKDDFITFLTAHFLLSPVKIWGNMAIIYFAYRIVSPLIFNKTDNGWGKTPDKKVKVGSKK